MASGQWWESEDDWMHHLDLPMDEDVFVFKTISSWLEQKLSKTYRRRFGFFGCSCCKSGWKGNGKDELQNSASVLSLTPLVAKTLNILITVLGQEKHVWREDLFEKSSLIVLELKLCYELYNDRTDFDLASNRNSYDSYNFANVLMKTLECLKDPIFTQDLFNVFCKIADRKHANRMERIRLALLLLPKENRNLVRRLLCMLRRVALETNANKTNARNLANVFAKCLFCPRTMNRADWKLKEDVLVRMLTFMIENATELFRVPTALLTDLKLLLNECKHGKVSPKPVGRWKWSRKVKKENQKVIKPTNGKPKRSFGNTLQKWFCFNRSESDDLDGANHSDPLDYNFDADELVIFRGVQFKVCVLG